jgi:hypothetical protein
MRRAMVPATAALLVGPTVLAFYAGGYFDGPRAVAAAVAWALVLVLAVAGPMPFPASRAGRVAVAGLAGLAVWSAVSVAWAPLEGPAVDSVQRLLLYTGALLAAVALLRHTGAARAAEPVLALGTVAVIGYGLSGRLLPGLIDLISARSYGAGGRLEQPITYWNGEGLLAAIGLVLCVRIAGDHTRAAWMRIAAAAACAPLGTGVYLSYSRGALAVTGLGLIVLLAAAPTWQQLRATGIGLGAGSLAAACSAAFPGVASLSGTLAEQERDGALMLAVLLAVMAGASLLAARCIRSEAGAAVRTGMLPHARRLPAMAAGAAALCVIGLVAGGLAENAKRGETAATGLSRFASVSSVRYEYWRVGVDAFWQDPVRGTGAGGFRVAWRLERRVPHGVSEVHSLPLEMAAELGLPGLALFGLFIGGMIAAAGSALRSRAPLAPAACAVCTAWLLHATIDWDWQLPAVTLPALVLAGGLLAAADAVAPSAPVPAWTAEPDQEEEPVTATAAASA